MRINGHLLILLLAFTTFTNIQALPLKSGEQTYEYNIFKLGAGLIDSSVMKYSKCVNDGNITSLEDLIKDTVKLNCNSNSNVESFCNCIDKVATTNQKRRNSKNNLIKEKLYFFLLNNYETKEDFLRNKLFDQGNILSQYTNSKCAPSINKKASEIIEPQHSSVFSSSVDTSFILDTHINKKQIELTDFIQRMFERYEETKNPNVSINELAHDINLYVELQNTQAIDSAFHKKLINDTIEYVNLARKNNPDYKDNMTQIIKGAIHHLISEECRNTEEDYLRLESGQLDHPIFNSPIFKDVIENRADNILKGGDDFYDFVEAQNYSSDESEEAEQRFEFDLFYCAEINKDKSIEERLVSELKEDESKFNSLQRILGEVKDINDDLDTNQEMILGTEREIRSKEQSIAVFNEEIELAERKIEQAELQLKSYEESGTRQDEQNSLSHEIETLNGEISVKTSQRDSLLRSIERDRELLKTYKTESVELQTQRDSKKEELTEIFGDDVADHLMSISSRRIQDRPYTYNPKTKKFEINKALVGEQDSRLNEVDKVLSSIEGMDEVKKKYNGKEGQKSVKNNRAIKQSSNSFETLANKVTKIPSSKLTSNQASIQNRLSDLQKYEDSINKQINKVSNSSTDQVKKAKDKTNESQLSKLREEINDLKNQQDSIKIQNEISEVKNQIQQIENNDTPVSSNTSFQNNSSNQGINSNEDRVIKVNTPNNGDTYEQRSLNSVSTSSPSSPSTSAQPKENDVGLAGNSSIDSDYGSMIVLSSQEFIELTNEDNKEALAKINVKEGETISVTTDTGVEIYKAIHKDGVLIGFEKVKDVSKDYVISEKKKEIEKIKRKKRKVISHSDLINIFSDLL